MFCHYCFLIYLFALDTIILDVNIFCFLIVGGYLKILLFYYFLFYFMLYPH